MSPTKSLVIVESPHKATMIAGYLGPKYTVRASQGHVRDLPTSASEAVSYTHLTLPTKA